MLDVTKLENWEKTGINEWRIPYDDTLKQRKGSSWLEIKLTLQPSNTDILGSFAVLYDVRRDENGFYRRESCTGQFSYILEKARKIYNHEAAAVINIDFGKLWW